ncbi:MAG: porin [Cyclobacteriaceae bacterium]
MKHLKNFTLAFFWWVFLIGDLKAIQTLTQSFNDSSATGVVHNSKGFEFTTPDGKYQLQIAGRLQFRFATPNDQNPLTFDDFDTEPSNIFKINRARLKIGGHAYQPWLKYYFEYEIGASRLLDFRVMFEKWPWFKVKFGQWKSEYSRERIISSGKQQMMERSIINRPFTLDRQQGVSLYGNLAGAVILNIDYHLMVLTGTGLGSGNNDDDNMMYSGRLQWNFLGEGVAMSGSDLEGHSSPAASLAWAGATNTSQYTRFSSQGGGELVGFEEGNPGQFSVDQHLIESTFKFRSLSWHSEFHNKKIWDHLNQKETRLRGWFAQGGYVINGHGFKTGKPMYEIAGRYARFRPDLDEMMNMEEEFSLALNCFFHEHFNKLSADVTFFDFDAASINREASGWRIRIQYDFSF